MARRRKAQEEEEVVDEGGDEGGEDEGAPAGAEFVSEAALKPRSDVYSLILILTFVAFLAGCVIAGREAWEHYDVQFWVFTKDDRRQGEQDQYEGVPQDPVPVTEEVGESAAPPPEGGTEQ